MSEDLRSVKENREPRTKSLMMNFKLLKLTFVFCLVAQGPFVLNVTTDSCSAQTAIAQPETKQEMKPGANKEAENNRIVFRDDKTGVDVNLDGQLFTRYDYQTFAKPILFPVHGPNQIEMTRNYPMKRVAGEQPDHPHQKSMWIGHEINGLDFWTNKSGVIVNKSIQLDQKTGSFTAVNHWNRKSDQERVLKETTVYQFGAGVSDATQFRWIDATVKFDAVDGDVLFNDTKEGMFALRVHPDLRSKASPKAGVMEVYGQIANSAGQTGNACWGQPAKWVHYFGKIEERQSGIVIFDHPSNVRHPTRWHARDYGLFAANPFGLHHFAGEKSGAGEYRLKKGQSLTQRYRVVFHVGEFSKADIDSLYEEFTVK